MSTAVAHINPEKNQLVPFAESKPMDSLSSVQADIQRNEQMMNDVRQENILLAEKVQQASTLYRQLLTRVTKTEERLDLDKKQLVSVISQAKTVELAIVGQHEQISAKENEIALAVAALQEEMALHKLEREQNRQMLQSLGHDVRDLHDKASRQSTAISTGLQELKSHLDYQMGSSNSDFQRILNELRDKIGSQEHNQNMFRTQQEGKYEMMSGQQRQVEKQRQEDLRTLNNLVRASETNAKQENKRLSEKIKDMFEELAKNLNQREVRIRDDVDEKVNAVQQVVTAETHILKDKFKELDDEINSRVDDVKDIVEKSLNIVDDRNKIETRQGIEGVSDIAEGLKLLERKVEQSQRDIEKVLRAEINSRISQGERLQSDMKKSKRDNQNEIENLNKSVADFKKKLNLANESLRTELHRMLNSKDKVPSRSGSMEERLHGIENNMEQIEEALDAFAKQDEQLDVIRENLKNIEMENVLSQGDMQNAIEKNKKNLEKTQEAFNLAIEELELQGEKLHQPLDDLRLKSEKENETLMKHIKILERKINAMYESLEEHKAKTTGLDMARPLASVNSSIDLAHKRLERLEDQHTKLESATNLLKNFLYYEAFMKPHEPGLSNLVDQLKESNDSQGQTIDDENQGFSGLGEEVHIHESREDYGDDGVTRDIDDSQDLDREEDNDAFVRGFALNTPPSRDMTRMESAVSDTKTFIVARSPSPLPTTYRAGRTPLATNVISPTPSPIPTPYHSQVQQPSPSPIPVTPAIHKKKPQRRIQAKADDKMKKHHVPRISFQQPSNEHKLKASNRTPRGAEKAVSPKPIHDRKAASPRYKEQHAISPRQKQRNVPKPGNSHGLPQVQQSRHNPKKKQTKTEPTRDPGDLIMNMYMNNFGDGGGRV